MGKSRVQVLRLPTIPPQYSPDTDATSIYFLSYWKLSGSTPQNLINVLESNGDFLNN